MGSHEAGDLAPRQASRPDQALGTDLDFIDILAFFWRWRLWLLMSAILGIASGIFLKLFIDRSRLVKAETSISRWKLEYSLNKSDPNDYRIPPLPLMDFLKTPNGSAILYDSVNKRFASTVLPVAEWSARQQSGAGLVNSLEFDGFKLLVTLNTPASINEDDIRDRIVPGLSEAIGQLNSKYFQASEELRREATQARLRLSDIALQAIIIIQESRNLIPIVKPLINEASKEKTTAPPEKKSAQELELWLAAIPHNDPRKKSLIESYQKAQLIQESIDFRKKALQKAAGIDNILKLDDLNPQNLDRIELLSAVTSPPASKIGTFSAGLMGAFFGLATSMLLVSVLSFFEKNRERLRKAITSQEMNRV